MTPPGSPLRPPLGIVAGGGDLPVTLARQCVEAGRPVFVVRLKGMASPALAAVTGADIGLAALGACFAALKTAGCVEVCFVGQVARPDFSTLLPDLRGMRALPGVIAAARKGDDALLRFLLAEFEGEGFSILGAHEASASLTLPAGALGQYAPGPEHAADVTLAIRAAKTSGTLDIGQAVVVAGGVVLAVEAQEGTDAMLRRCLDLPAALKGTAQKRIGVLVKWPKPIQERRVDLPVIGFETVRGAAAAGLAGIVGEAGGALLVDRQALIVEANRLGLFIHGETAGS